jgi:putative aminopeptidase FrvX
MKIAYFSVKNRTVEYGIAPGDFVEPKDFCQTLGNNKQKSQHKAGSSIY